MLMSGVFVCSDVCFRKHCNLYVVPVPQCNLGIKIFSWLFRLLHVKSLLFLIPANFPGKELTDPKPNIMEQIFQVSHLNHIFYNLEKGPIIYESHDN